MSSSRKSRECDRWRPVSNDSVACVLTKHTDTWCLCRAMPFSLTRLPATSPVLALLPPRLGLAVLLPGDASPFPSITLTAAVASSATCVWPTVPLENDSSKNVHTTPMEKVKNLQGGGRAVSSEQEGASFGDGTVKRGGCAVHKAEPLKRQHVLRWQLGGCIRQQV